MVGRGGVVLRCDDPDVREVEWPRYECSEGRRPDGRPLRARRTSATPPSSSATPAPPPTVSRVLVVAGRPILLTDQTLEVLDPETFQSVSVTYHPTRSVYGY